MNNFILNEKNCNEFLYFESYCDHNFEHFNIHNLNFNVCDFKGSNFKKAIIKNCNIINSNLNYCNLTNMIIENTDLSGTSFKGVIADGLVLKNVRGATVLKIKCALSKFKKKMKNNFKSIKINKEKY